ncbi:hormogonium polysaccharide secretion pseudopilin HpsB [Tychonema sp. LEGE 06208]|uniref:hormogonium polysaccharide secretion pseudopilin HpsB n=1 Tax=Tychonema sp. LEGE 06208 TaxID=1828663 RepID=UPI001881CD6A|nr:hormogonium polysaccharide secretion pseudopilin HpsB [Tychonema sp. LEGE 06208]MBE9162585.1 type II secretion system protein [Tychonema sp. LEGE 06208]
MTKPKQQQNLSQSRDGGYTIIESLVAMIVVSVLMIAIAPVMAFSVATRVQARRVELATQAARAYIDALRTGAIKPTDGEFPAADPAVPPAIPAAPGSVANLYCVDLDENPGCTGNKDFRVQGVRQSSVVSATNLDAKKVGYGLIVRVYRADATGTLTPTGQSIVGAGLGNPKAPLVVMSTEIPPAPEGGASSYRSICTRTGGC